MSRFAEIKKGLEEAMAYAHGELSSAKVHKCERVSLANSENRLAKKNMNKKQA